ncbi:pyridoxamine 5'-phosphate oxidase family protein [Amycolatopsis xylanica]|uniref:pyridoxamine 5'-phosphate oxidase family protein n=1 Tax=Amycolatopsis xylanica TaxID=589385 RepID=UPI000B870859|nr:pyridoxamine 5'-phosphate oxidase family protein [Amycolatopsis xylanica]
MVVNPSAELLDDFVRVAHRIVWCTLVTVDRRGRPRSRVVHPYWERDGDRITGWVFSRPTPLKLAHLANHPYVSCSYWDPAHEIAVAECGAEWAPSDKDKVRALFGNAEPPLGYDADMLGPEDSYSVLKLTPWRLSTAKHSWQKEA